MAQNKITENTLFGVKFEPIFNIQNFPMKLFNHLIL